MNISIASFLTLITAISYSWIVYCFNQEKLWDWFNTLVGTSLSFFLAILGGMFLLRLESEATEKSERSALRALLLAEFSDLIRILNTTPLMSVILPSGSTRLVLIAFIQPIVTEKAALSGLFRQVESENLLHLARKLRMLNFKSDYFIGLIQSNATEEYLIHAIDNVEETRIASIESIRHVAKQLGLSINESYPD